MALTDIDVLLERVRSSKAKSYVSEAVTCYKAGAFRTCIVAIWIALIYDFVDKFRELALSGDSQAKELVEQFDRMQASRDTAAALKFEREVLDLAKAKFELLSEQECIDLKRLFEDRNRFGHPNLNQDYEVLNASPELARSHLRNAVEHVMGRPPVQGKSALAAIQDAVDSSLFPRNVQDAVTVLSATPLARAKRVVVRDFFLGAFTSLFREKLGGEVFERRMAAAFACRQMHRSIVDEVISERASNIFDKLDKEQLPYLIVVLSREPDLYSEVSNGVVLKLRELVSQLEDDLLGVLNFASEVEYLRAEVVNRLKKITHTEFRDFVQKVSRDPSALVIDRALELLETSSSWDSSNAVCSAITERMLGFLGQTQARRVLYAGENGEVQWSFNYPPLVQKLVAAGLLTAEEVVDFARQKSMPRLIALFNPQD